MEIEIFEVAEPSLSLLSCDFCYESEAAMIRGELREMYRMKDGCLICESCLAEGVDREEDEAERRALDHLIVRE